MGRLIDADRLKSIHEINKANFNTITGIREWIDSQPTAYDVEKVIAELESFAKLAEDRWANGTSNHACQEHRCWVKAIEIVRKGGGAE